MTQKTMYEKHDNDVIIISRSEFINLSSAELIDSLPQGLTKLSNFEARYLASCIFDRIYKLQYETQK